MEDNKKNMSQDFEKDVNTELSDESLNQVAGGIIDSPENLRERTRAELNAEGEYLIKMVEKDLGL